LAIHLVIERRVQVLQDFAEQQAEWLRRRLEHAHAYWTSGGTRVAQRFDGAVHVGTNLPVELVD
jgi:hypothetical protein